MKVGKIVLRRCKTFKQISNKPQIGSLNKTAMFNNILELSSTSLYRMFSQFFKQFRQASRPLMKPTLNNILQQTKYSSTFNPHLKSSSNLIVFAGLVFSSPFLISNCASNKPDQPLTKVQLAAELRTKLAKFREKQQFQGLPSPGLHISTIGETFQIEIDLPRGADPLALISSWLFILSTKESHNKADINVLCQPPDPKSRETSSTISFISQNKQSSMVVRSLPNSPSARFKVSIYKDGGFTPNDLDYIAKGYGSSMDKSSNSFVQHQGPGFLSSSSIFQEFFGPEIGRFMEEGAGEGMTRGFQIIQQPFREAGDEDEHEEVGGPGQMFGQRERERDGHGRSVSSDPIKELQKMGLKVFDKEDPENTDLTWDSLAGYDDIKKEVEVTIVNSLRYPEVYDSVARGTREVFETNRPRAVLLEGPPGTGKTLTVRILASRCEKPLVVLKMEQINSKWYGEGEKKMSKILDLCDSIEGGVVVFLDEVDAVTSSRDSDAAGGMHEATRRMLAVILQRLEGFENKGQSILVCATNRREDLDPALLSRFDLSVQYPLPDFETRIAVMKRYAKHLQKDRKALEELARESEGLSCRDLKEACEHAERVCACRVIDQQTQAKKKSKGYTDEKLPVTIPTPAPTPTLQDYISSLNRRKHGTGMKAQEESL